MANEPKQYKVDQTIDLINSLNSGVIVKLVSIENDGINGEKRIYNNNLEPLIAIMQNTNFNTVELDRIVEATSKLTDSIYHPKAEFDAGYDLRYNVLVNANEKVSEVVSKLEVGQAIKLGVNDDYQEFIETNINKAFRDNIGNYANGILMNDVAEHMDFIDKRGKKTGLSSDEISAEQEKFMTALKAGEFGLSANEKYEKLSKVLNKYSLFTDKQPTKDPKTIAKDIAHSIDGFMDDLYTRRKERRVEGEKLGLSVDDNQGYDYQRPRSKM